MSGGKLLLVDGHYYSYRSFYAIRQLSNSRGEPTNAIYGVTKALKKMSADIAPTHAAMIFDGGLAQERLELVPGYKSTRKETPQDLSAQFDSIQRIAPCLGFPSILVEGVEADDLIASYTKAAKGLRMKVIVATSDKDLMQLVDDDCWIYQPESQGYIKIDAQAVVEKWGVAPNRIAELLALTGDAVDDIPGVSGVGPKTAASWLEKFGTLDALLGSVNEISSEKLRAALEQSREQVAINLRMVQLREDLHLPVPMEQLQHRVDWAAQAAEFEKLEFKSFLKEAQANLPALPKGDSQQQEWAF